MLTQLLRPLGFSLLFSLSQLHAGQASPSPGTPSTSQEIVSWCTHLSKELRSVNYDRCVKREWKLEALSPQKRPIPSVTWGDDNAEHRILILGAIHGDEISAVSMTTRWLDFLDRTKTDSFLRKKKFMFMPLVNPDGFYAVPRTRTNANGVDINRNFSTSEWSEKAQKFWKVKTASDPRRFPGAKAASELETQVVEKAVENFKPDLIISVHAPYCLVDHDGPINFPTTKSPLPVRTLGSFPGSLGTYAGVERSIPVVTPELPSAKTMPDEKSIEQLFIFIMQAKY